MAAFATYAVAFFHFVTEALVYKTVSKAKAAAPFFVSSCVVVEKKMREYFFSLVVVFTHSCVRIALSMIWMLVAYSQHVVKAV